MVAKTLARTFAEFASDLTAADIPAEVRRSALWHIVDSIGVCIAAASPNEPSGRGPRDLADRWKTAGGATVFGVGTSCRPEFAAILNGALAQALEMDDKHGSSLARPGSTVTPAVLAIGEDRGVTLSEVVTAVIVGYEVMIRLGFVAGDRFLERGYHTSSLLGGFGAAAAVGRLLGCSVEQIVDAFGIAGTFASGIQESTRTGSTSKILHGGWGAHSGILATELARSGITGPDTVFEGRYGFFRTHLTPIAGELDWSTPIASLGSHWHLPATAYKPYPCCQLLHAFIEAAKQLLAELAAQNLRVDDIERISCWLAEPGLTLVTDPPGRKLAPEHAHEARFSLPFVVASALINGDVNLDTFRPSALIDPRIRALAAKVRWAEDADSDYPLHCPAILELEISGRAYRRHVPYHPGSPEAPLTEADVLDKFASNTTWLFGERAREIGATLTELPEAESLRRVVAVLGSAGNRR